ncbi:hypothetical protein AAFF_G00263770 [Aldrovandia affinis]|uniref:Uncharacterized protein n=1 Tax=Aldrovandia affinis TaxID=143900 RepID=A0AAD7WTX2_9TELE|nr:hypothetical protein AAFF_G00263770 [Aldrovandia affinis]
MTDKRKRMIRRKRKRSKKMMRKEWETARRQSRKEPCGRERERQLRSILFASCFSSCLSGPLVTVLFALAHEGTSVTAKTSARYVPADRQGPPQCGMGGTRDIHHTGPALCNEGRS